MKIYLAARFSRQDELTTYKYEIEAIGFTVTSRWLTGTHGWSGVPEHLIPACDLARFAREDLEDVDAADLVISFTEPAGSGPARGGRHVEYGYALARGKRVAVVGPVENIFHTIPIVARYDTWDALKLDLPTINEILKLRMLT